MREEKRHTVKKLWGGLILVLVFVLGFCGPDAHADCADKILRGIKDRGTKSSAVQVKMGQCFNLILGCTDCQYTHYTKYTDE